MGYTSEDITKLKRQDRFAGQILAEQGQVKDLAREEIIVHVGKPAGSVTGWVGPVFWQVWVETADPAGTVRARIDRGAAEKLQLEASLPLDKLLDTAKDQAIAKAQDLRAAQLAAALAREAALAACA